MLNRYSRESFTRLITPVARMLLRLGLTPDIVTLIGTVGASAAALFFFPRGDFFVGTLVITVFVLADTLDGTMARLAGRSSSWGAFLDSVLDRVTDAAILSGLLLWFALQGDVPLVALTLACLVLGQLVSYARARAEGLQMTANVGFAERAERLIAILVATGLVGLGVPAALLTVVLWILAAASLWTVFQRVRVVRQQTSGERLDRHARNS